MIIVVQQRVNLFPLSQEYKTIKYVWIAIKENLQKENE